MAPKLVVPLMFNTLTPLMAPPMTSLPDTVKLKPAPAIVELAVVIKLDAEMLVLAPKVTAPAYVWLPLVLNVPPFNAMVLPVTFTWLSRLVAPKVPPKLTALPAPLALMFKVRLAAESLLMLLATAIVALAPVLCSTVFWASVTAPVYVWLPVVLTELPFKVIAVAFSVRSVKAAVLPNAPFNTRLPPPLLFSVSPRAVPSLLMVLWVVMTADALDASNVALAPKVMAPV